MLDIRCLSLLEPWASLVALGLKRVETRGWKFPPRYRGPLGIHASMGQEDLKGGYPNSLCERAGVDFRFPSDYRWPLGSIVCIVDLTGCTRTEDVAPLLDRRELAFGNYAPGRLGLTFGENRVRLEPAIPHKGALGLWRPAPEIAKTLASLVLPWTS